MKLSNNQKRIFALLLLLIGLECYMVEQVQLNQDASRQIVSIAKQFNPESKNVFEKMTGINGESTTSLTLKPTPKWGIGFFVVGGLILLSTFVFKGN
ncbi:MAG: hypothetical protein ACRC10_11640 [Thermoguttaceae bacterium]